MQRHGQQPAGLAVPLAAAFLSLPDPQLRQHVRVVEQPVQVVQNADRDDWSHVATEEHVQVFGVRRSFVEDVDDPLVLRDPLEEAQDLARLRETVFVTIGYRTTP